MSLRLGRRRALRDIARDLADSDPRLDELFLSFNQLASGGKMPRAETGSSFGPCGGITIKGGAG
jgi:hypothetical protein